MYEKLKKLLLCRELTICEYYFMGTIIVSCTDNDVKCEIVFQCFFKLIRKCIYYLSFYTVYTGKVVRHATNRTFLSNDTLP